jgi:hypothetical protein
LQSKAGSGQRAQDGQGGHFSLLEDEEDSLFPHVGHVGQDGQAGHTGGTTWDFKMYKSSCPSGIILFGIPGGKVELYIEFELEDVIAVFPCGPVAQEYVVPLGVFSVPAFTLSPL